jgi:hypothetical protein
MTQVLQRRPFEMPFIFSLNQISSVVADHLSKKALLVIYLNFEAATTASNGLDLLTVAKCLSITHRTRNDESFNG